MSRSRGGGDIPRQKRGFAMRAVSKEMNYIDKWFKSIVKPKCFYEKHAGGAVRRYFYNIDLQGRLFLGMYVVIGCFCNSEFHADDNILIIQRRHYQRILRPRSKMIDFSISSFPGYACRDNPTSNFSPLKVLRTIIPTFHIVGEKSTTSVRQLPPLSSMR